MPEEFTIKDKVAVVGIGETEFAKAGGIARSEFQLACEAILAAVADAYLSVSAPVMAAAPKLLALAPRIQAPIAARLRANLSAARAALGTRLIEPGGGWYAVVEAPDSRTDEEWALALLESDGVLVQPGYFFNFPREAFLVVSLLSREDAFGAGVKRLAARLTAP